MERVRIIKNIEQITSTEAQNILPADTINLLWYIWETECQCKEATFNLNKLYDKNKQNINVSVECEAVKSFTVTLDNPVNADVLIKIPRNRFVMEIKK